MLLLVLLHAAALFAATPSPGLPTAATAAVGVLPLLLTVLLLLLHPLLLLPYSLYLHRK
jgi:hypothetical protein